MLQLDIFIDAEGMLSDVDPKKIIQLKTPLRMGALKGGMQSGKHAICFGFTLPNGQVVFAETSMKLFHQAAKMYAAKFGWQDDNTIQVTAFIDGQNRDSDGGSTKSKARD